MATMNSNIKVLAVIFCGFVAVSLAFLTLGLVVPAIIIAFFGGLACLERAFRWIGEANTKANKLLAWGSGFLSVSPAITLLAARAVGFI
jgi:hypothetical protein